MSRPTDWSAVRYSCDPIPGDPLELAAAADRYHQTAAAISTAATNLRRLSGTSLVSKAFQVTFERIDEVATKLDQSYSRVQGAGDTLARYWPKLEAAQTSSAAALRDAEEYQDAKRRSDQKVSTLATAHNSSNDPAQREELKSRYLSAQQSSTNASHGVNNAIARIKAAIAERDAAAQAAMHEFDDLDAASPVKDNILDKAVDWFEKNVLPIIKEVVKQIAEFAEKYGTIIDIVGSVLSVLALFIPGVGPLVSIAIGMAFAGLSALFSLAKMANAGFKLNDGEITPEEFQATMLTEGISIGLSVLSIAGGAKALSSVGKVAAKTASAKTVRAMGSLAVKSAAKETAEEAAKRARKEVTKRVLNEVKDQVVERVKDKAKGYVNSDAVSEARRRGEERLHQERIQQEEQMREVIHEYRSTGQQYRRMVGPCAVGAGL